MNPDDAALFYLDGEVTIGACPKICAEDRGFIFGDGIYEVIRVYGGKPLALDRHLRRLKRSAQAIDLDLGALFEAAIPAKVLEECSSPQRREDPVLALEDLCSWLIRKSALQEAHLYMEVTRGAFPRSHAIPAGLLPSLFCFVRPMDEKAPGRLEDGVSAITWVDSRWLRCDIKSVNLLPNILAKTKAAERGAYEAILYRVIDPVTGGFSVTPVMTSSWGSLEASRTIVTEGSSTNVFIVRDGEVFTHPADNLILPGITRELLLESCAEKGVTVREEKFGLKELFTADEVFLTGTGSEIAPVTSIDGRPVKDGKPGPVTLQLAKEFSQMVDALSRGSKG